MAEIEPIPLQTIPPVFLAVHDDTETIVLTAVGGRETLQAPAAPETDCLELRSKYFCLAYLSQAGEMIQIQVLEHWEFQHAIWMLGSYFI